MRQLSHTLLFLFAINLTVFPAFAQVGEQTLKRHVNDDGRFEAMMPANARSVTVPGKEIVDTYYEARGKAAGADFKLKVQVISPIDLGDDMNKKFTDGYVAQAREQQQEAFGTAKTDKQIKQHGMQGRDFVYELPASDSSNGQPRVFRQRVMFDGKRLYIATHIGSADAASVTLGAKFLDSVKPLKTP